MKNKRVIAIFVLVMMFLFLAVLVKTGATDKFDTAVTNLVHNTIPERVQNVLKAVTTLGGTKILPIIIITIAVTVFLVKKEDEAFFIIINSIISTISYLLLKSIIKRPRPYPFRFIEETGYSFPSGHATSNMAFFGLLIYLTWKNVENKKIKILITIILSFWILLIGTTRIYFNVHYPSDIIGGIILGTICILVVDTLIDKNIVKTLKKEKNNV